PAGSANVICGPRSAARGAVCAFMLKTSGSANSAHTNIVRRPPPTPIIMMVTFYLGLLDFDLAGDHGQLRGSSLERLPDLGIALGIRGDDLVREGAARVARRDDPDRRPEEVSGGPLRWRRMGAELRIELLSVG